MILLDSDVMIDILREYDPAILWFNSLNDSEELLLPGYVVMELIQGCRNKYEQEKLNNRIGRYISVWPTPKDCGKALNIFTNYRLSHNAGLFDVLIGQTAIMLNIPLHTFNHKHYAFIPGLKTIQPYEKGT